MVTTRFAIGLIAAFGSALGLLFFVTLCGAQEPPKATPPTEVTVPVSSEDALLWERYQLWSRLAAAQQDLLRLQNEKTLAEEYAKLDATFHAHYKISVNQVERRGDQWIPRQAPLPAATTK